MRQLLNRSWRFRRLTATATPWVPVDLPHSPFVADLDGREHWFGECEYQCDLQVPPPSDGARYLLEVGAAMHTCRVLVGEGEIARHTGGYLPFEVDLTDCLDSAGRCHITLHLDNRDNPDVPPGKAYEELDFCWYGGLYREVTLRLQPAVHLTSAISAGEPGGGGVFLRTLAAATDRAEISSRTHVRNLSSLARTICVRTEFKYGGHLVAEAVSPPVSLEPGAAQHIESRLVLANPTLWSPASPELHDVTVTVLDGTGAILDSVTTRFGIRRIGFSRSGGFTVNGRRLRLRGTNRHQEVPRVGYAAPRAAQQRDARRIKEAGFDYVRLSHYPQSPDFLDACDQLGIVVMNCIPGWQFIGGPYFREAVYADARQMIRRDRNHACVVLWELSLNETDMDEEFMAGLHAIGHEEYPGDQMFTCGWIDRYDVFSHSRQHGQIHRWSNGDKALVIAEYGDWEYYARNEGFDQKTGAGIYDLWSTARQFRADGERGLAQQALNHRVALNDTLASPAVLDGQWAAFDYARGYNPIRAAVGVMDIFRLPKFSYYLYRSQRDAKETAPTWTGGPVVFIASHWTPASTLRLTVFSNCEEVALHLNDRLIGRTRPVQTSLTQHLPHPPFYFDLDRFEPGCLKATGYIGGAAVTTHTVATPGSFARLELAIDDAGIRPALGEPDVLCVHARLCDEDGTLCVQEISPVVFNVTEADLVGPNILAAEAGIASIVVRIPPDAAGFTVTACAPTSAKIKPVSLSWGRTA
jgi:beta-galactosidase